MLAGKIRESVDIKNVIFAEIAVEKLLQQPVHLISRIPLALGAKTVVGFHQQRQLFQLLGKGAICLGRGVFQIFGANAATLEFVHRFHQAREKFRAGLHGGIGFQNTAELTAGRRHGHHTAAIVQAFSRGFSQRVGNPSGQTGKRQHLRKPAGGISRHGAEPPLHIMADELRNHQDPATQLLFHIPGHQFQDGIPSRNKIFGKQKLQHPASPFLF